MASGSSHVLYTSSVGSDLGTSNIWDYNTGNSLKVYKNGGIARMNSLQQLGNDYFLTADNDKPLLHIWNVNKQEPIKDIRLVLPNPAKALAISPDNGFITAAIGTKLYTWELNTGLLLSVIEKHLLPITCIKFAGYYLISASESGSIITYAHSDLVSTRASHSLHIEPRYVRNDHTSCIVDMHVGCFGVRSRFATASTDCTSIIYQAATGEPLCKLVLNSPLSCILTDNMFVNIFIGTEEGKIIQQSLCKAPRTFTDIISNDVQESSFLGHKKCVNCLDIHINAKHLASGGEDNMVYIWDISSRSVLTTIDLKTSATNVKFVWNHVNIYAESFQPKYILKTLQRNINTNEEECNPVIILNHQNDITI